MKKISIGKDLDYTLTVARFENKDYYHYTIFKDGKRQMTLEYNTSIGHKDNVLKAYKRHLRMDTIPF